MKAAIIGAAGFLGQWLARRLCAGGAEVLACDVPPAADLGPAVYRQLDVLADPLDLAGVDAVFYLAQSPFYQQFPKQADHLFGVNVFGAVRAATAAAEAGARFFCYTSTGNVYAPSFAPLAEEAPVRRDDPYGLSKLAAEESLALFRRALPLTAVRIFGLFGPGQTKMLPVRLCRRIIAGEAITLEAAPGEDGAADGLRISLSYVADTADILTRLAERALAGGDVPAVLNVAGPEGVSLRRFAEAIGAAVGRPAVFATGNNLRKLDLVADIARLRALLSPRFTPLAEAVPKTFDAGGVRAA